VLSATAAKLQRDLRGCMEELKTCELAWEKRVRAMSRVQSLVEDDGLLFMLTKVSGVARFSVAM